MALAETAELAVKLTLDNSQFTRALSTMDKRMGTLKATAGRVGKGIAVGLGVGATAGVFVLGRALQSGIESLRELETVTAQTEAVIKSTGAVAGVTAEQVRNLAEKYEGLNATIDDKVIQSAENLLLTFTNINEKAFEPALQAVLDFSVATGTDATAAAKQLGRALNDPVKGMSRLERQGVSLDKQTQDRIKQLAKEGDLYGAQTLLLDELTKRYGGSFARAGDTAAGKQAKLQDAIEDVQKALASKLLPVVTKVSERITKYLAKPETIAFFERLSDTIASLFTDENLDTAASAMQTAASAVSGAISMFNKLPPEIKALAIGAFALNKVTGGAVGGAAEAFGKIVGAGLKQIFAANVTVIGKNVTGGGVGGKVGTAVGVAGAATGGVVAAEGAKQIGDEIARAMAGGDAKAEAFYKQNLDLTRSIAFGPLETLRRLPVDLQTLADAVTGADDHNTGRVNRTLHQTSNAETANERGEGAKHRAALAGIKAKEQQALVAFREGERTMATGNTLTRTSNAKLAQIARKPTKFTATTRVNVTTSVSVAAIQQHARYRERVSKSTGFVAS